MRHRKYEAEVSRFWGQDVGKDNKPRLSSRKRQLNLALAGLALAALVIVQALVS
ncbi:MAG: hypothetical protein AB1801_03110 [Chloroflexota bacterium]